MAVSPPDMHAHCASCDAMYPVQGLAKDCCQTGYYLCPVSHKNPDGDNPGVTEVHCYDSAAVYRIISIIPGNPDKDIPEFIPDDWELIEVVE